MLGGSKAFLGYFTLLFILSLLFSCSLSHYNDGNSLKLIAKFPSAKSKNGSILSKPEYAFDTYVPSFIDRIEATVSGTDFNDGIYKIYDPVYSERLADVDISNEMDFGRLPYGEYDIEIKAYAKGFVGEGEYGMKEVYSGKVDSQVIGTLTGSQEIAINLERTGENEGVEIDDVPFTFETSGRIMSYRPPLVSDEWLQPGLYCSAISEKGDYAFVYANGTGAKSLTMMLYDSHFDAKFSNPFRSPGTLKISPFGLDCAFSGDRILITYYEKSSDEIDIYLGYWENGIWSSKQIANIEATGVLGASLDVRYDRIAAAFLVSHWDSTKKVWFTVLDRFLNPVLKSEFGEAVLFCEPQCRLPEIRIIERDALIILAPKRTSNAELLGQKFRLDGTSLSGQTLLEIMPYAYTEMNLISPIRLTLSPMNDLGRYPIQILYDYRIPDPPAVRTVLTDSDLRVDGFKGPYLNNENDTSDNWVAGADYPGSSMIHVWSDNRETADDANGETYNVYYDVLSSPAQTTSRDERIVFIDNETEPWDPRRHEIIDARVVVNSDGLAVISALQRRNPADSSSVTVFFKRYLF